MAIDWLVFIAGIIYGYMSPGKEDKGRLLRKGVKIGVIIGVVFGLLNLFMGGLLAFGATLIGFIIGIAVLTIIFIVGTIIGDWLEARLKK